MNRSYIHIALSEAPSKHHNIIMEITVWPWRVILVVMIFGCVRSDFAQDKKECGDKLTSLSTCLPFVSGEVKVPASSCCTNLRQQIESTKKCLCLLIKDRNDPNLGFKINATLALSLPSICHSPANVTKCPEILHLAPNSTEAQVFEQPSVASNSSAIAAGNPDSSSMSSRDKKWLQMSILCLIISTLLIIVLDRT